MIRLASDNNFDFQPENLLCTLSTNQKPVPPISTSAVKITIPLNSLRTPTSKEMVFYILFEDRQNMCLKKNYLYNFYFYFISYFLHFFKNPLSGHIHRQNVLLTELTKTHKF